MKKNVCIVGLGYVGLPLAILCLKRGFNVFGYDIDKKKINDIKNGKINFYDSFFKKDFISYKTDLIVTTNQDVISKADIVMICVPTPVDKKFYPDLTALKKASKTISEHIKKEQLVIVESTVYPGVTDEIIKPILEKTGLKAGRDFYLAYCPERIDPGNKNFNIENIPRVFAGISDKCASKTRDFYESILNAEIKQNSSIKAAEAVKVVENTFRDVNIAMVNELAKSFDIMGIDIVEVIDSASTKPYGFMPHYPGCGVGGHCIPVDPYYLIERGKKEGFDYNFLSLARKINKSMPQYTLQRLVEGLNEINKSVKGTKITVLGLSYKKDIDDMRNSPAVEIINSLRKMGGKLEVYDPFNLEKSTVKSLKEALEKSECIIVATDHSEFKKIKIKDYKNIKVVIDGRNCLNKNDVLKSGIIYKGIGRK